MGMENLREKITALIDNEIKSVSEREELELLLKENDILSNEFLIQKSVKSLLGNLYGNAKAPKHLYENITKQTFNLYNTELENKSSQKEVKSNSFLNIFIQPKFAIPAVILIIAIFLSSPLFNERSTTDLIIEQSGTNNMYVQAVSNFKSILKGELSVQCSSQNPIEVKEYFVDNGVAYETKVPAFKYWDLVGGVVSENGGKKFAHQLYSAKTGKLLYLYQVDIDFISNNNEPIKLSENLLSYLHQGKCLKMTDSSYKIFLWENDHKIYALVTNEDTKMIEDNFLASF